MSQLEKKQKKKTIPKVVKDLSWNMWIGEDVAKHVCLCCETNEIKMSSFHCGHIVAEANGGITSVENLRPICRACNLSMGTEDMNIFKQRCGFGIKKEKSLSEKIQPLVKKEKKVKASPVVRGILVPGVSPLETIHTSIIGEDVTYDWSRAATMAARKSWGVL